MPKIGKLIPKPLPKKNNKPLKLSKVKKLQFDKHKFTIDTPDNDITTPEIEKIRKKLKEKLRPSEKMKLARQKNKAIIDERKRLGIYVEESESDTDMNLMTQDNNLDNNFNMDNWNVSDQNTKQSGNIQADLGQHISSLVQNSLDTQQNPQNKDGNIKNIMNDVNNILKNVMNNVTTGTEANQLSNPHTGNKVNIFVRNNPNEEAQLVKSFDFGNNSQPFGNNFDENFKNFMPNDNDDDDDDDDDDENELSDNKESEKQLLKEYEESNKYLESLNRKIMAEMSDSDNDQPINNKKKTKRFQRKKKSNNNFVENIIENDDNDDEKNLINETDINNYKHQIHDKGKAYKQYKNNMMQYLESICDSEDEPDFDALKKKKEAEENGVNLSELMKIEDEEEMEENIIELDLEIPDFEKFRSIIDSCDDYEKLINVLNLSIKEQAIRERNIQYISRRLKTLVNKIVAKEVKECEKKEKIKTKKNVKGGINECYSLSSVLCKLLGYPKNSKKPWTTVTKDVWKYINENGLKDPDNTSMIIPDKAFRKCFDIKKDIIRQLDVSSYIGAVIRDDKNKNSPYEIDEEDDIDNLDESSDCEPKIESIEFDNEDTDDEHVQINMTKKSPTKKTKSTNSKSFKLKK
jgi:hypothetical protein